MIDSSLNLREERPMRKDGRLLNVLDPFNIFGHDNQGPTAEVVESTTPVDPIIIKKVGRTALGDAVADKSSNGKSSAASNTPVPRESFDQSRQAQPKVGPLEPEIPKILRNAALEIARGDSTRLKIESHDSVLVVN
jgi:hypothetical protein